MQPRHRRRTAALLAIVALVSACATRPATAGRAAVGADRGAHDLDALQRAETLVSAGCLDCLVEALATFSRLEDRPALGLRATRGAAEAATLIAARERELGLDDTGVIDQATSRLARLPLADSHVLAFTLEIVDLLPAGSAGGLASDREIARRGAVTRRRQEIRAFLEPHADESPLLAYMWLSFHCSFRGPGEESTESLMQHIPTWGDAPLLAFRRATCRGTDRSTLDAMLARQPGFAEVRYFTGRHAIEAGLIDEAIDDWQRALDWRPRWPALALAQAEAYLSIDEWDRALGLFERVLEWTPDDPAALLGKARALTYLARHENALAAIDRLLSLDGWYPGDARYWRALNETQLERYPQAWEDIERAAAFIVSADVSKLAGIIAYRLGRSEVARTKFEEAWRRNGADCEVGVHLSIVYSGLRAWAGALDALGRTATCLEAAERQLTAEIDKLRATAAASSAPDPSAAAGPAARRVREVADREARLATGRRLLATVWFNSAVASFYSARMDDARMFAERVLADAEFGGPARTLLARIP